jgi:catechol 2,3-dioxygenase-like lactoylglutathione lyase family enzyme
MPTVTGIAGIDHAQIAAPAGCEPAARAFFGGLLGLQEVAKPPVLAARGGVWFACGAQQLHVGVEAAFAPSRKAHVALRVRDVGALHELASALERAGRPVRFDDAFAGRQRFYVDDPWGNRLELIAEGGG